jgi:RNA polymerase sigma-B factor
MTELSIGDRDRMAELSDDDLLTYIHGLPRHSQRRAELCEILVARYSKLVWACVRQYRDSPESVEDLMQAGYLGLIKAINNFDPQVGDNLSAYAQPCVSGEIKRHFRDKRWQVHVQRSAQERVLEFRKAAQELVQDLGRDPHEGELADKLGVATSELREVRRADMAFRTYSLDAPVSDREGPANLADLLGEEDQRVEHALDMEAVHAHWGELPEREQRILVMRFYGNLTQAEIGERLGISQMHVSRLLTRALSHLRSKILEPDVREPA